MLNTLALALSTLSLAQPAQPPAPLPDAPLPVRITIDAANILRTFDPQRLGGTNVAMWYYPATYDAPEVQRRMPELKARYIRIPGGSWANGVYWNGNGVRDANGNVDPTKVGPDGYPAVDYSAYDRSFLVNTKTLHPSADGWHGHVDVKKQHDFIRAIPGSQAMACPNAGTGRAIDAAEWVKWANKTNDYNVRYWEIGNELGGSWEAGTEQPLGKGPLTAEIYTQRYNEMASAMRKVDHTIKIGSCPYVEEALRDCGDNVDFVSIHTYPGSRTQTQPEMFADIGKNIRSQVDPVRGWIRKYQPNRVNDIEITYSEWNLGGGIDNARLFSGLWSSIFLGEIATAGVDIANQWDAFSDLFFGPDDNYAPKSEFFALALWNNYMGNRLVSAKSTDSTVFTYATVSDDALTVMIVNTNRDQHASVDLNLSGFSPAPQGETATFSTREYHINPVDKKLLWSIDPRIATIPTSTSFNVSLTPYSITYLRIPAATSPALSARAQKALASAPPASTTADLHFLVPTEVYAGDRIEGELIATAAGSMTPFSSDVAPATLTSSDGVILDRSTVRLPNSVGHFTFRADTPGEITLTAASGNLRTTHKVTVKPSVPRPVIFWDFSNPLLTSKADFLSDFTLVEDLTQRANRVVARIDLPPAGVLPTDKTGGIFKVDRLPDESRLNKSNIRGVVFDLKTSADLTSEDPNANVMVIMQSTANWWMRLGNVPLKDLQDWKTFQFPVTEENHINAMPAALNIIFVLNSNKPVKGSIYLDKIGFLVR